MMTDIQTSNSVKQAITEANQNFMSAFKLGDAARIATYYTENGQLLPTGSDFITGQTAIQAFWQGAMDMGVKEVLLETVEADGHGDHAQEVGRYTLRGEGDQVLDQGKYIVLWQNQNGQWKLHRDIWNTSASSSQ